MAWYVLFLVALVLLPSVFAEASWKKVAVTGTYPGRGETAFSRCGGSKLCLLGGRGPNRVHILDSDTLEWSAGKQNSLEMHHFQGFQGPDECIWVVGAWTGPYPNEETINNIWRYCTDSNEWFMGDPVARPRGSGGAFFYNGKVYLVTGNVGGHRDGAMVVPWFDSYDPQTGKWERLPDIPHARDHCHAVVRNNKVYVAGGRRSISEAPEFFDDTVAEVDVYDFGSGTWSTITSLSRPRGGTVSAVYNNKVFLIGGEGDNRAWTEVDVLENDNFQQGPSLPEPRHGTGAISCNGAIWIAGGARVLGGGNNAKDTYAFFEGENPPPCREAENSASIAEPSTSEDTFDSTEIAHEEETQEQVEEHKEEVGIFQTTETPIPADVPDPVLSPMPVLTSEPVASSTPTASPSFDTVLVEGDGNTVAVERSPESSEFIDNFASENESPQSTGMGTDYTEESDGEQSSKEGPGRHEKHFEKEPSESVPEYSVVASTNPEIAMSESPRASPMQVEVEVVTESPVASPAPAVISFVSESPIVPSATAKIEFDIASPSASPLAVELDFVTESDSSELPMPSHSVHSPVIIASSPMTTFSAPIAASTQPTPSTSVLMIPSPVELEESNTLEKSSMEPSILADEMGPALDGYSSPEPTALVDGDFNDADMSSSTTEEPHSSDLFADDDELFLDPEPSSTEIDDGTGSCFPSNALVELQDGSMKPMALLRIGDRVKVAHPAEFSEVFFFSHKHPNRDAEFLELKTSIEGTSLTLSPGHLVYANGELVKASAVKSGDQLSLGNDIGSALVTGVSRIRGSGLHNPHTLHGDIVVNGVVVSTFTSAVHPSIAKLLLKPFKVAFYALKNEEHMDIINTVVLRALERTWWKM